MLRMTGAGSRRERRTRPRSSGDGMRIGIVGGRDELGALVAAVVAATGNHVEVAPLPAAAPLDQACDLVVVDPVTSPLPAGGVGTGGSAVVVAHLAGEEMAARRAAGHWAASTVVELPRGGRWLAELVARAPSLRRTSVLHVVGATGGCGTSTLAVAAALAVGGDDGDCLLVDADPWSTGLDLALGVPDGQGARWGDVPADAGALVADTLRTNLPQLGGAYVLTGPPPAPQDPRVVAAVRAGRDEFAHCVVDSGRDPGVLGAFEGDAFLVVLPCTLAGVVGARRILSGLPERRVALALRPTGWMAPDEAAGVLGCPRTISVPRLRALPERAECGELAVGRLASSLAAVGAEVWAALR